MEQFKYIISRRRQVLGAQACPTGNPREKHNLPFLNFFQDIQRRTPEAKPTAVYGTLPGAAAAAAAAAAMLSP